MSKFQKGDKLQYKYSDDEIQIRRVSKFKYFIKYRMENPVSIWIDQEYIDENYSPIMSKQPKFQIGDTIESLSCGRGEVTKINDNKEKYFIKFSDNSQGWHECNFIDKTFALVYSKNNQKPLTKTPEMDNTKNMTKIPPPDSTKDYQYQILTTPHNRDIIINYLSSLGFRINTNYPLDWYNCYYILISLKNNTLNGHDSYFEEWGQLLTFNELFSDEFVQLVKSRNTKDLGNGVVVTKDKVTINGVDFDENIGQRILAAQNELGG
jgi:hypothetical protein